MPHTTLIATLGAEPQVITLALQLLEQAGEAVTHVVVLHTLANRPPLDRALPALQRYFAERAGPPFLQTMEAPLADVLTPAEMEAFTDALYTVVRAWVAKRGRVHLLLAGGRKSMTLIILLDRMRTIMPNVLVTAGNVFDPTFDGVCFAVKMVLGGVDAIHIFDTAESATQAESGQRNARIRNILGDIDITTTLINDQNLQKAIPDRLSRLIREYGANEIIVDLSNGQKVTVAVLYAVSTISRIPNIYALEFYTRVTKETRIADLTYPENWQYVQIQPLREILNITQSSYVELIYYRDRIETISELLLKKNRHFAVDVKDKLEHSLIDYFAVSAIHQNSPERLERCVNGLGKICEDVARLWHDFCYKHKLFDKAADNFASRSKQLLSRWDKFRGDAASGKVDYAESLWSAAIVPTLVTDTHLEAMRVYRNLASHSLRHYHYSKHDARLALDLTLMILERLAASTIVDEQPTEV